MEQVTQWLQDFPPLVIYLIVGGIIGLESMGIPLPGEITLVSASLLTVKGVGTPLGVATFAAAGAIIGDSIGYAVGKRGGRPMLNRLGRRFPKHLGEEQLARAEGMFARWGTWAVFFGRFVALLRILAGPMAGALKVPYRKFLLANAAGGLVWAYGTVYVLYWVGEAAEQWLKRFSWAALILAVLCGVGTTLWFKHRAKKALAHVPAQAAEAVADEATAEPARTPAKDPVG